MSDFSEFGLPNKEWQDHVEKYGPPPQLPDLPAIVIQKSTNDGRDEVSAKQMIDEGLSSKVDIQTLHIHARDNYLIPIRIYSPKASGISIKKSNLPIYVFYHGGGFIYGTLDSEDAACSRIAAATDILVVHVNYRHTPQHPFPAAHNDALDAFDWIIENAESFGGDGGNLVVGGISAGANLAVHVALARNSTPTPDNDNIEKIRIKGLLLGIPWLVINSEKFPYEEFTAKENTSRVQCNAAPVVYGEVLDFFVNAMGSAVKNKSEVDPDVGLVSAETLKKLPSTTFLVAGNDPLRDEGLLFAQRLHKNRVPVDVHAFPGLPHGFRRFDDLPSSRRWDEVVVKGIKWSLNIPRWEGDSKFSIIAE